MIEWVPLDEWRGRVRSVRRDGKLVWQKPIGIVHDEGKPAFVEVIDLTREQYEQDCKAHGYDPWNA